MTEMRRHVGTFVLTSKLVPGSLSILNKETEKEGERVTTASA